MLVIVCIIVLSLKSTAGSAQGTARSPPASNTRSTSTTAGGLGGLGSADLGSILGASGGGGPDATFLTQVLQNPTMMQMMQNLMSNPQSMNQV